MNILKSATKPLMSMALLVVALAMGCKGGRDPILGGGGIAALKFGGSADNPTLHPGQFRMPDDEKRRMGPGTHSAFFCVRKSLVISNEVL